MASGSRDGTIRLWSMEHGKILGVVRVADQAIDSIALSPNGQHIASASHDGVLRFWKVSLIGTTNLEENVRVEVKIKDFAVSGGGKRVFVLTEDGRFIVRCAVDGGQIGEFDATEYINCIALNYSGCHAAYGTKAGVIKVWNTEEHSDDVALCWKSHHVQVSGLAFSRDCTRLASHGYDDYFRIRDISDNTDVGKIEIEDDWNGEVAFSFDGQLIIHSHRFGETKVWKTDTKELVFHLEESAACPKGMSEKEVLTVLQNFGPKSSYMWPDSLKRLSGDAFLNPDGRVYYKIRDGTDRLKLHKFLPYGLGGRWEFILSEGTFVTIECNRLVICRLLK